MTSSFAVTTPTNLSDNGYTTDQTNYLDCSPLARWVFRTSATKMHLKYWDNLYGVIPDYAQVAILVNGSLHTTLDSTAINEMIFADVALPSGLKTVVLVTSLQTKQAATLRGTFLKSVYFSGAGDTVQVEPSSAGRVLVYGDSIAVGDGTTTPASQAWTAVLRSLGQSVMVEGWGYRQLYADAPDADGRTAFAALLAAYAPAVVWIAIGTNDYGLADWSAADFGTAYADLLDKLHAALPAVTLYCQTPLSRTDEGANAQGDTLGDYRTQISTAVSTRTAYCVLVDGTAILTQPGDFDDNVHPNVAGHAKYASYVDAAI